MQNKKNLIKKIITIFTVISVLLASSGLPVLAEEIIDSANPATTESTPVDDAGVLPSQTTINKNSDSGTVVQDPNAIIDSDSLATEKSLVEVLPETTPLASLSAVGSNTNLENQKPAQSKVKVEADQATGALVYEYPILAPAGRNNLSPDLKLKYNSQDQDNANIFGYGWSINIPYIERINRKGADRLYIENYFNSSLSGELKSISLSDNTHGQYGSKIDNGEFLKYEFKNDNSWTVQDKQGFVYKYGLTANSKQDNADGSKVFKWMLEEVRDQNDNFIKYEYFKDAGQIYPAKIIYTGHSAETGIYSLELIRESRPDIITFFSSGFETKSNYRIKEIKIKTNSTLIKKYTLSYTSGDNGMRSMLSSIKETAWDEAGNVKELPATELTYQKKEPGWESSPISIPIYYALPTAYGEQNNFFIGNINGDGYSDYMEAFYSQSQSGYDLSGSAYLSNGNSWNYINIGSQGVDWKYPRKYGIKPAQDAMIDVDGDSRSDIIHTCSTPDNCREDPGGVFLNKNKQWTSSSWQPLNFLYSDGAPSNVYLSELNGDGLIDYIQTEMVEGAQRTAIYLNNGNNWSYPNNFSIWQLPIRQVINNKIDRFTDINGDGLDDFIRSGCGLYDDEKPAIYLNSGDAWLKNGTPPVAFKDCNEAETPVKMLDANGDGLIDFVSNPYDYRIDDPGNVYINTGSSWSSQDINQWFVPYFFSAGRPYTTQTIDINGDGLVDLTWSDGNGQKVYLSKGKKPDLLIQIKQVEGAKINIEYKPSTKFVDSNNQALNPNLPFVIQAVSRIQMDDGLGNISNTNYEYAGGEYYFKDSFNRKFAGFAKVKKTDDYGNSSISYYHQGNDTNASTGEYLDNESKIGKIYRTEIYDNQNKLYSATINKWESVDLGNGRNFVKLTQAVEQDWGGQAVHRDKAESYIYNDANGNLNTKINWGEVSSNNDSTFIDIGSDKITTNYSYAVNSEKYIIGLPSGETIFDQNNKVSEDKYYYDNLIFGQIDKGNLTKNEKWVKGSEYINIQKEYNAYGLVIKDIDPRGNATRYVYDIYNLYPAEIYNALNQRTSYEYDYASGQAKKIIEPNGAIMQKEFDGLGRVKTIKQSDPDNAANLILTNGFEYNDINYPRSIKEIKYLNTNLSTDNITYFDGLNRIVQTRSRAEGDNQYSVKDIIYNKTGQVDKESLPYVSIEINNTAPSGNNKLFINYTYDALNRPLTITNALGATANQYQNWQVTTTDPLSNKKTLESDARGNLVKVTEFNGNEVYITQYNYNGQNKLIKITDALNNVRNFIYDGLGRLLSQEDLHALADITFGIYNFTYDPAGNLATKTTPNGENITYIYDELNRIKSEDFVGTAGIETSYVYDSCLNGIGRLCETQINANLRRINTYLTYYSLGQVKDETKIINQATSTTGFVYDYQNNTTQIIYSDSTIAKYDYNAGGQVEKIWKKEITDSDFVSVVEDINYNSLGQIIYQKNSNNIELTNFYDETELYRLKNKTSLNKTSNKKLQNLNYIYDTVGNIKKIIDSSQTNLAKTSEYAYDNLYRLTSATTTNAVMGDNFVQTYKYDAIGNILNKSHSTGSGQADIGNYEYKGNESSSYANPHAVTKANNKIYSYDKNGNLTSNNIWTHAWDYNNRLASSANASTTVEYMYDADGSRVIKNDGENATYYVNKYFEYDSLNNSAQTSRKYIYFGDQKVATIIAPITNPANTCQIPQTGDWTVNSSCTLAGELQAPANVIVNAGAKLTIAPSSKLLIDFKHNKLLVKKGGSVLVKKTGAVKQSTQPINQSTVQLIYHLTDHLSGSNVDTDKDGNILEAIDYYPFGSTRVDTKTGEYNNNYKYTGKELDADTGLYYYGARYYDAGIGRFVSEDPISLLVGFENNFKSEAKMDLVIYLANPQILNNYSYAINNPLKYNDPDGKIIPLLVGLAVVYAVPVTISAVAGVTAMVASWHMGAAVGSLMEGDQKSADSHLDSTQTTLLIGATGVEGALVAGEMIGIGNKNSSISKPNTSNSNAVKISPNELKPTEKVDLEKVGRIQSSMQKNGYYSSKPIKYLEVDGEKFIVDGHHRQAAASNLGLDVCAKPASEQYLNNRWGATTKDFQQKINNFYGKKN